MRSREDEVREIPLFKTNQATWPKNVRSIAIDETDGLGVDASGRLYWDGKPVEIIGQRIVLTFAQKIWAVIFAIAGLLAAAGAFAQGWVAFNEWGCKIGLISVFCLPS